MAGTLSERQEYECGWPSSREAQPGRRKLKRESRRRHAAPILLAEDGDDIVTSDSDDLEPRAALAGRYVELPTA